MKLETRALWAMPMVMLVAAAIALVLWLRNDDDTPAAPDSKPSATAAAANACPVPEAICEFAVEVERVYREGDLRELLSRKSAYYPETGVLRAADLALRGPLEPRVMAVGCPIDPTVAACADAFSLVLTSYPPADQVAREHRVILGFQRDGIDLPIINVNILAGGIDSIATGGETGRCDMSGRGPNSDCLGTRFYLWSSGPDVVREPTPAPRPTPSTDPLAGIAPVELSPAGHVTIGYDTVVYYSTGCFACGRPRIPNLFRLYRDPSGALRTDDLFGPLLQKAGGGYPKSLAADWDRGHFLVQVCARGYCGGEGDPSPDATVKLFRSRDGGVSWAEEPATGPPPAAWLNGFAGGEAIVIAPEHRGAEYAERYFLYPSGRLLEAPPGIGKAEPYPDQDGRVGWLSYGPTTGFYNEVGDMVVPTLPTAPLVYVLPLVGAWLAHWAGEGTGTETFGIYHGTGELAGVLRSQSFVEFRGQLWNGLLVGNAQFAAPVSWFEGPDSACKTSQPVYPVLANWNTGAMHPILELGDCPPDGHKFVDAIVAISFVRVNTPADCLNLRAAPSTTAPALGCFADGVLLPRWLEGAPAPVSGWLPVFSPDFDQRGWVATEFVAP